MRWLRAYQVQRLIRAQKTLLHRIKIAKMEETNCMSRSVVFDDPGWMKNARDWRRRRQEHVARFLSTQNRIDQLLEECAR